MNRWSLGVSVLSLLVAIAAAALTAAVYITPPLAISSPTISEAAKPNTSQVCLSYRSQVLNMHIRGVYPKQMIDIFNLETVTSNSKGEALKAPSPAYDAFYKGTCGAVKDIIARLSNVSRAP
jgi:hypothetical protein